MQCVSRVPVAYVLKPVTVNQFDFLTDRFAVTSVMFYYRYIPIEITSSSLYRATLGGAVYTVAPCLLVALSVRHMSMFYQEG